MFGIKTFIKEGIAYPLEGIKSHRKYRFPLKSSGFLESSFKIFKIYLSLTINKSAASLGNSFSYPSGIAARYWKNFIKFSPNNSGNWTIYTKKFPVVSARVENELFLKLTDLFLTNTTDVKGYMTSGATEGNIFSCWLARKYLEEKGVTGDKIVLLKSDLTHYSISKSADLTGIKTHTLPLSTDRWNIDIESFGPEVERLYKKGVRGFVLPLTLGYTTTGTSDDVETIIKLTRDIRKKFKKALFFIWLDAAQMGLVKPFIENNFSPFKPNEVGTFVFDFHKFGFAPIPSGVILYRSSLKDLVKKPIDYLEQDDYTLLGSRNGISPMACSAIVDHYGKSGFKKIIRQNLLKKNEFIKKCRAEFGNTITIINDPQSLTFAVVSNEVNMSDGLTTFTKKYYLEFRQHKLLTDKGYVTLNVARVSFLNEN